MVNGRWTVFNAAVGTADGLHGARVDLTIPALMWMKKEAICPIGEGGIVIPLHETCLRLAQPQRDLCMKGRLIATNGLNSLRKYREDVKTDGGPHEVWERMKDYHSAEMVRKRAATLFLNLKSAAIVTSPGRSAFDPVDMRLLESSNIPPCSYLHPGFAYATTTKTTQAPVHDAAPQFGEDKIWTVNQEQVLVRPDASSVILSPQFGSLEKSTEWATAYLLSCANLASELKGFVRHY